MNVLLLTAEFPPEVRSAALLMGELADTLAERGHNVTVITALEANDPRRKETSWLKPVEEQRGSVRVLRIPTLAVHRTLAAAIFRGAGQILNALAYLVTALSLHDIDVSLAYSPPLPLGIVGSILHRLRGIPHVLNVQDLVPQYAIDLGILKNPALIRVLKWVEKTTYKHVQRITVHSRGNAEYMAREGVPAAKVGIVPNWVDTRTIRPSSRETEYRKANGLEGKFVVLFAGALGFAQDVDTIVEAGKFLKDRDDIVVLIVGDGVEKARLAEKARALGLANVRFMPVVSAKQYPEVVASADLCLATLQKSLQCPVVPSKLLGYMAAGRPVVACFPEGGDAPRVIHEADSGINVPAGEPEQLAQAILLAASQPDKCREWGEHGRKFVEANHDRQRVIALYESIFAELVTGHAVVLEKAA